MEALLIVNSPSRLTMLLQLFNPRGGRLVFVVCCFPLLCYFSLGVLFIEPLGQCILWPLSWKSFDRIPTGERVSAALMY